MSCHSQGLRGRLPAAVLAAFLASAGTIRAQTPAGAAGIPNYPPPRAATPDWCSLKRVVFHDPRYPVGWVRDPGEVSARLAERGDYAVLGAEALKAWMDAQIEKGAAGSVCVLTLGIAPDTVAERPAADCTARRYLDAGGRMVWIGDVPFYYQGHAGGGQDTWGPEGQREILSIASRPWDLATTPRITEAGKAWGVTQPDVASRGVDVGDVTLALTADGEGHAFTWFKNLNPRLPQSGFLRYRGGMFQAAPTAPVAGDPSFTSVLGGPSAALTDDLLRLAVYGFDAAASSPPSAPPPGTIAVAGIASTSLFARREDGLRQLLRVTVENWWRRAPAVLRVHASGRVHETAVPALPLGRSAFEADAPVVDAETPVAVEVVTGGLAVGASGSHAPRKRWTLFLDPSVHTDIGYTDLQENVLKLHNDNIDKAVKACAEMPSFKWDLENAWQLEHYEENRTPEQTRALLDLVRSGRVGVAALYLNILTGACSAETLNRSALAAAVLRRRFGIRTPQALLTDVPTAVATLPTVLARSGVRYFAQGINQTRGPYYADPAAPPMPFWWEGPDGSRVLTWLSNSGYANAAGFQLTVGVDAAQRHLTPWLEGFEKRGYPYDAVLLYGGVSDNQPLDPRYAAVLDEWNRRYAYPRLILAAQGEFFEHMERAWGDRIPVLKGDNGCYWEDGAASTAFETTLNRRSQEEIVTAEKLSAAEALLAGGAYPDAEILRHWRDILFYIEHTWGAHNSISQPDLEFVHRQWEYKAEFARRPAAALPGLVRGRLQAIAGRVRSGDAPAVLVFNPLSWDRSDVVRVELPEALRGRSWTAARSGDADLLPAQPVDDRTIAFLCPASVGGIGWETLLLREASAVPAEKAVTFGERSIENAHYRVVIDADTGGIASLLDRELGRDLIDSEAPYRANEYLYVAGGDGSAIFDYNPSLKPPKFRISRPRRVSVRPGADGPVFGSLIVETKNVHAPRIVAEIVLYRGIKRVDIVNRIAKEQTYEKEAVYFPFPFRAENPDIRLEIPDGVVRPESDQLGGACRDWYAVQRWIEVADSAGPWRVTLSAPDSLLFCVNDIFRGKWMKKGELKIKNGHLYAWVMNNYWMTNYKAGQGGDFEFRFSITSDGGPPDDAAAVRFGWGVTTPLVAAAVPARPDAPLPPAQSLLAVDRAHAVVTAFKRAEGGDGWVVRLLDTSGAGGPARLRFPAFAFTEATLTNLVEEPLRPLKVEDRSVEVPLEPRGIATVRLR